MNEKIVYKEFGNNEEFHTYFKTVYTEDLCGFYINRDYFWIKLKEKDNVSYTITTYKEQLFNNPKSKIGFFVLNEHIGYFYLEGNKIYTVIVPENIDDIKFDDKLYRLTHGSKALSIPEAFKVLSL